MLTVQFVDHREAIKELLARKLLAAMGAAAVTLAESYKSPSFGLQQFQAPPHSRPGEIPYKFNEQPPYTNKPPFFSAAQTTYLSDYIEGGSSGEGKPAGFVGFLKQGHVTERNQNYLIDHDQQGRPWVKPIYDEAKVQMVDVAKSAFEGAN